MLKNHLLVKKIESNGNSYIVPVRLREDVSKISDYDPLFVSKYFELDLDSSHFSSFFPHDNQVNLSRRENQVLKGVNCSTISQVYSQQIPTVILEYSKRTSNNQLKTTVQKRLKRTLQKILKDISQKSTNPMIVDLNLAILFNINTPSHVVSNSFSRLNVSSNEERAYLTGEFSVYDKI
ncbi:MAG: hypothetical protein LAT82_04370 [Nanoarchaeota archaeon]|nr:hypothetical protein [Nanoarchaeota archaeon]